MPDVQVLAPGVSAAPLTYTVPGSQEILIKALSASFDGSGAAGAFVPAVRIIAPGGKLAGVFIANGQVSAGDSVYASWAPFLAGAGPNGIQFDVPNRGNWLAITTEGAAPLSGDGIMLSTFGGGGVEVLSGDFLTLSSQQDGLVIESNDPAVPMQIRADGGMAIQDTSAVGLTIENTGSGEIDVTDVNNGIRVRSGDDTGYPFNLTTEAVTIRAGSQNAAGAVEISAFEEAAADRFSMVLVGNWTFGSPAVPHHGVNVLIRPTALFSVCPGDGTDYLRVDYGGQVSMPALPAVNPGGTGKLWNNGGVVNIT